MEKSTATRSASHYRQATASLAQRRQPGAGTAGVLSDEVGQRTGAGFGPHSEKVAACQRLVDNSLRVTAQRKQIESAFGMPMQRHGSEEEELLQGKFTTAQRQGPEEEELLQGKFVPVQRQGSEEEELLQGKFGAVQLKQEPAPQANNTGLPDNLKAGIENLSGMSMDDVKVHYNSSQPAQLNALAYAQGTDINVASGQDQHLPHEAWHVVQQAQGRVKPTMQMKDGVPVNDDEGLEREADAMSAKAMQMRRSEKSALEFSIHPEASLGVMSDGPVQRMMSITGIAPNEVAKTFAATNPYMMTLSAFVRHFEPSLEGFSVKKTTVPEDVRKKAKIQLRVLIDLGLDVQGVRASSNAKTQKNKAQKERRKIRARMQEIAEDLIGMLVLSTADVTEHLEQQIRAAVEKMHQERKGVIGGIKNYEVDKYREIINIYCDDGVLVSASDFLQKVRSAFGVSLQKALAPPPALSQEEEEQLAAEKTGINLQLAEWSTIVSNGPGTNEIGTWGTSAGGAGGGFAISSVTPAVLIALRKWWEAKANAWVSISDTSDYSLKMDRSPATEGLSERFNYHINSIK